MEKYIVVGAGHYGEVFAELVGIENIVCFIDNNVNKQGKELNGKKIYSLDEGIKVKNKETLVIAVSEEYYNEIECQLKENSISDYVSYKTIQRDITRRKILKCPNYIEIYNKAVEWIKTNTIPNEGIINNTKLRKPYPEVTGYYIPTLIRWGYKDLAISYAKWLCSIQKDDGSWYDTDDKEPYVFDTGQILKGLLDVRKIYQEVDDNIIRGCDWLLKQMTEEGRLVAPNNNIWGDGKTYSEIIHTYCISPIYEAGKVFKRQDYIEKADKMTLYYTTKCKEQILNFGLLSHFYAYVVEAMLDIGKDDLAYTAMERISLLQKESGAVPAYNNVDWVCSTGLFQLAAIWFRLGDMEIGDKAFYYACKLQNQSGGWYGSYISEENPNETNTYFPDAEISWAVKYFLDALYYKNLLQFENQSDTFLNCISVNDGRYQTVKNVIKCDGNKKMSILDVGCGKGRYIRRLVEEMPQNDYYAVDLSSKVIKFLSDLDIKETKQGNLTNIPYDDNFFDIVFTCEALEHAVDVKNSISELIRVTRLGGTIIIIDKNKEMLGYYDIEEWEQWFEEKEIKSILQCSCSEVKVVKSISFDDQPANGLFYAWIGIKK